MALSPQRLTIYLIQRASRGHLCDSTAFLLASVICVNTHCPGPNVRAQSHESWDYFELTARVAYRPMQISRSTARAIIINYAAKAQRHWNGHHIRLQARGTMQPARHRRLVFTIVPVVLFSFAVQYSLLLQVGRGVILERFVNECFVCLLQYIALSRCAHEIWRPNISKTEDRDSRFHWDTNRKWHTADRLVTWPMTTRELEMSRS